MCRFAPNPQDNLGRTGRLDELVWLDATRNAVARDATGQIVSRKALPCDAAVPVARDTCTATQGSCATLFKPADASLGGTSPDPQGRRLSA
jgi:hypothetical protein